MLHIVVMRPLRQGLEDSQRHQQSQQNQRSDIDDLQSGHKAPLGLGFFKLFRNIILALI
jgi:hypothetical protein